MSQCGDQNDIFVYVLNVFIGIAIAVYFLPCKKNHPVDPVEQMGSASICTRSVFIALDTFCFI